MVAWVLPHQVTSFLRPSFEILGRVSQIALPPVRPKPRAASLTSPVEPDAGE